MLCFNSSHLSFLMIIFFCQSNYLAHWQISLKSIFMLQMVFIFNFIHDCLSNSSNYTVYGSALTSSFPEHSLCSGLLCKLVEESSPVMDLVVLSYNTAETPRRLLELGQQSREVLTTALNPTIWVQILAYLSSLVKLLYLLQLHFPYLYNRE